MFNLPSVDRYTLHRAPLAQALAQVRFPLQARLGSLEGIAVLQERLNPQYPYLEQPPAVELQIAPGGAQAAISQTNRQYVFKGDDGHAVAVGPDVVTLTTDASYGGADDFKARFDDLLRILQEDVLIPRCNRIAAKYLTLAEVPPGEAQSWVEWFRPELLGWTGSTLLADDAHIVSAINQVQLRSRPQEAFAIFPGDVAGVVRHGLIPAGSLVDGIPPVQVASESYVIDVDLFCEFAQPWDRAHLSDQFSALHEQIDRFFRWTLTAAGESHFELEEG